MKKKAKLDPLEEASRNHRKFVYQLIYLSSLFKHSLLQDAPLFEHKNRKFFGYVMKIRNHPYNTKNLVKIIKNVSDVLLMDSYVFHDKKKAGEDTIFNVALPFVSAVVKRANEVML